MGQRIERMKNGNFGDSKTVGEGVFELRVDVGTGYRVYFTNNGKEVVILLVGGDKSTQDEDIKTAKEAGITRDGLYKALAPEANPAFSTVFNILRAIGYTLTPTPIRH